MSIAGVGGMDLGLERSGWHCAGQVEIDPWCRKVLAKHWPQVWKHNDVRTVTAELVQKHCGAIDAIVGGPPCQPASVAGRRTGAADYRWLWPDFLRVVFEVRPVWVLAENPGDVLSLEVYGTTFLQWAGREFEDRGYEILPVIFGAEDVGASHRRRRLFLVAHANRHGQQQPQGAFKAVGRGAGYGSQEMANTFGARLEGYRDRAIGAGSQIALSSGSGLSQWPAMQGEEQYEWEEPRLSEYPLGVPVDGLSERLVRGHRRRIIKALGNAVVPACAEVIGRTILETGGLI
ncbi:MAG TPA: DNA cytosine methyltransferase [Blastocatellia bacterium]|nr:DNA cytosine methyltransferase [Blastocatellia bacterium]